MVRTGFGGGIPGVPTGSGGSDDDSDSSSGSGLGGSIPGAPDDGGGSDGGGIDPSDPSDAPSASPPSPAPEPDPASPPSTNVDETTSGGPLDQLVENTLNPAAETFDEQVAETAGEAIRASSPATLVDSQVPGGSPVGRGIENTVRGAVNVANVPGIAAGAIRAGQRAADDTARANREGAAGRRANRRELASDIVQGATRTGTAIRNDPVATLSRIGGGIVGGAALGGAASRAARGLRGTPDAPDTPDGTVPSGRSDIGTEGLDSLLEDVDLDARRGTSAPSTRSRLEGEVSRAADDVSERVSDAVDPFVPSAGETGSLRAGLVPESATERRTADAPRDFDGDDRVSDNLVQQSLNRQQRAERGAVERGDFERTPAPFRDRGGDTIDPDGGVSLQRGAGVVDDIDAAAGSSTAGSGLGTGTGLGAIAGVNDPTGIADTGTAGGTGLDPAQVLGAGTDSTGAGAQSEVLEELGAGRLGGGTLPGDATGTGTDTDSGTDTFSPTDTGSDTGSEPGTDTPTDTATTTADVLATTTLTGTRSGTDAAGTGTSLPGSPTLGDPVTSTDAGLRLAPRDGDGGGRPVRPRGEEEADQDDGRAPLLGFATDSREFGSGIASASDFLDGDGARDPFSL